MKKVFFMMMCVLILPNVKASGFSQKVSFDTEGNSKADCAKAQDMILTNLKSILEEKNINGNYSVIAELQYCRQIASGYGGGITYPCGCEVTATLQDQEYGVAIQVDKTKRKLFQKREQILAERDAFIQAHNANSNAVFTFITSSKALLGALSQYRVISLIIGEK